MFAGYLSHGALTSHIQIHPVFLPFHPHASTLMIPLRHTPEPAPLPRFHLFAAAHRLTFLSGTLMALIAIVWWLTELYLRHTTGISLAPEALPAPILHAWLMLFGVFPFFIFGFLFTAVPNWLNGNRISRRAFTATGVLMAMGALLIFVFPVFGLVLHGVGWGIGTVALFSSIAGAATADKQHAWLTWAALVLGGLGTLLFLLGLQSGTSVLLDGGLALGLWGCLVPVFLTVCHRMVPWFTSRVLSNYIIVRPYAALYALLLACLIHAALDASNLGQFTWIVDLTLAGICFWLVSRWGIARSFDVRLLAMLHIAFVWAGFAFACYALDSLARFSGQSWSLGLAPLHALGMGFFGSMLVGMASRVSLGHSGYRLEADLLTWRAFWLVQATALFRVLADVLPFSLPIYDLFVGLAGVLWLIALSAWAWRYAPMYWRPRVDGKPG